MTDNITPSLSMHTLISLDCGAEFIKLRVIIVRSKVETLGTELVSRCVDFELGYETSLMLTVGLPTGFRSGAVGVSLHGFASMGFLAIGFQ